jgi:hypothetical protein
VHHRRKPSCPTIHDGSVSSAADAQKLGDQRAIQECQYKGLRTWKRRATGPSENTAALTLTRLLSLKASHVVEYRTHPWPSSGARICEGRLHEASTDFVDRALTGTRRF